MNGIIPLWKPKGLTSHDCVVKLRKLLKTKKIGHTGTLDPEVEGVLPITIGKSTKLTTLITDRPKTYLAELSLGKQTTTEDQTGDVVEVENIDQQITFNECKAACQQFEGQIKQIPPMYSAVKINGKKLYEYAREGIEVDRPAREVTLEYIDVIEGSLVQHAENDFRFKFRVRCSSGTYVRTLCVDIGKKLGFPAHMASLVREYAGSFSKDDAVTFSELERAQEEHSVAEFIQSPSRALNFLPVHVVSSKEEAIRYQHGQVLPRPDTLLDDELFRVEDRDGQLIAVYQKHPSKEGLIKPFKVLYS
nr:tRNA pseudouridine(55) synthase TruB [Alkalibacillus aidingensis]